MLCKDGNRKKSGVLTARCSHGGLMLRRVPDFHVSYAPEKRGAFGRIKRPAAARIRVNSSSNSVRVWLFAIGLSLEEYEALIASTQSTPLHAQQVGMESSFHQPNLGGRNYWLFQNSCYYETEGLDAHAVTALLTMRQRKLDKQVERARTYAATPTARETASRQAIPDVVKMIVWERDRGRCVKCGAQTELQFDHVIPVALGGGNDEANIQVLCGPCNRRKRDSIV
jgi:hypothetical protein